MNHVNYPALLNNEHSHNAAMQPQFLHLPPYQNVNQQQAQTQTSFPQSYLHHRASNGTPQNIVPGTIGNHVHNTEAQRTKDKKGNTQHQQKEQKDQRDRKSMIETAVEENSQGDETYDEEESISSMPAILPQSLATTMASLNEKVNCSSSENNQNEEKESDEKAMSLTEKDHASSTKETSIISISNSKSADDESTKARKMHPESVKGSMETQAASSFSPTMNLDVRRLAEIEDADDRERCSTPNVEFLVDVDNASNAPTSTDRISPVSASAQEIFSGQAENCPEGWIKKIFLRVTGETNGRRDSYWYSPLRGYKLRSKVELRRFLDALEKNGGNEEEAFIVSRKK